MTDWQGRWYSVSVDERRCYATVTGADGRLWAQLRLLASVDCLDGPDETVEITSIERGPLDGGAGYRVVVTAASSRWDSRRTELLCGPGSLSVRTTVTGTGRPTFVHLLGGWHPPAGFRPSGSGLAATVSPNPDHPSRQVRPAVEPATIGVVGEGGDPGVGRWLFTPAPWCLAVTRDRPARPTDPADPIDPADPTGLADPGGAVARGVEWAALGIVAGAGNFTQLHYLPVTDGFSVRVDYEGHTGVDGRFEAPEVVVLFGEGDAFAALRRHRDELVRRGVVAAREPAVPGWWLRPMFCGWGAQCELSGRTGVPAPALSSRAAYDGWLAALAEHGLVPGTVTVDDKWQREYATCRPDPVRWPDLKGWIAERHAAGQRVLLWWKAWDPEGAPASACVRDARGRPVAVDPDHPDGAALVAAAVAGMLGPAGLDADGLKVDFTARTPSGVALRHHGPHWGAALLHRLLEVVHQAARRAKPDALVVTHTPNPAFAGVTGMLRLNDAVMLDAPDPRTDVVAHLGFRAAVVAAACPGTPVDTDGWAMPDRAQWRRWVAAAPRLGVPSLYYATEVAGEPLDAADYAAVRAAWAGGADGAAPYTAQP
jgi:hypothetical protein